jgi:hypothetical protein
MSEDIAFVSSGRRAVAGFMRMPLGTTASFEAVLVYEDGHTSAHPFHLMRDGEAFLRKHNAMRWPVEPLRIVCPTGFGTAERPGSAM